MLYAYHLNGDITLGMHEYLMIILRKHVRTGMVEPGGKGAQPPPDFGRSENGGAPHYYSPSQIFRPSFIPV